MFWIRLEENECLDDGVLKESCWYFVACDFSMNQLHLQKGLHINIMQLATETN